VEWVREEGICTSDHVLKELDAVSLAIRVARVVDQRGVPSGQIHTNEFIEETYW
jgi:hypothetical protein